jgi:hypothetical protein
MEDNIFLPKKIKVGFQERDDTYTNKLAYVIYYDEKGVVRKEKSWNSWRDPKIDPVDFDNVPTTGFVLNKKVGGYKYDWNARNTYVRVYDPRNFEFEISVPNLLFILEYSNSIRGKGLEGEFIYGWSGAELLLMPTTSPDYVALSRINDLRHNKEKVGASDLILGATYRHKSNFIAIYMGRFDKFEYEGWKRNDVGTNLGKHYFFYDPEIKDFKTYKSLGDAFIEVVESTCHSEYSKFFDKLEKSTVYSPIDESKTEYIEYTLAEFLKVFRKDYKNFYTATGTEYKEGYFYHYGQGDIQCRIGSSMLKSFKTLEEVFNKFKPCYQKQYLTNGKFFDSTKAQSN